MSPAPSKLIGSVAVQPATARPGQAVFVQVLDPAGHPYPDDSPVTITINGVPASSRYYQFALPGRLTFVALAISGGVAETQTATAEIVGEPMAFRLALTEPVPMAMPIIQARQDVSSPYIAEFSLSTPASAKRAMARNISFQSPAGSPAATPPTAPKTAVAAQPAPGLTLEDHMAKFAAGAPAHAISELPPRLATSLNGTQVSIATRLAAQSAAPLQIPKPGTTYKWDFGDGQTATTESPNVTHNYFPAIKADRVAHSFHVACTIVHDNISVTRSLLLHSAYGLCRRTGVVVPFVTGDVYATLQKSAFAGSLIVHNPEPRDTVILNRMAVVPISVDSDAQPPAPRFVMIAAPVTIKPNSSSGIGVYVPLAQLGGLGPAIKGFTVYYCGTLNSPPGEVAGKEVSDVALVLGTGAPAKPVPAAPGAPVKLSWHFRIRLTDSGVGIPIKRSPYVTTLQSESQALTEVEKIAAMGSHPVSQPGNQTIDRATGTVAIALSANPHSTATKAVVRSSVLAGTAAMVNTGHLSPATGGIHLDQAPPPPPPPTAGPVQVGEYCDRDNISDAEQAQALRLNLACQQTSEHGERSMPGSYQNAMIGDVILAPGGGDTAIGVLLGALGQSYSHDGIMTQNQVEITHCTAAGDRYGDYLTGIMGAGGIQPDVLQYGWPGSVTQTIDNAINGQQLLDPNGKQYKLQDFNATPPPELSLVPPLVIKPWPENEDAARPILRKVAALAQSKGAKIDDKGNVTIQKGACYYSFYGYTKPEIGAGFGDPAPASAGWAQGLTPAVCSSFVWLCMKELGAALVGSGAFETLSELSANAIKQGGNVNATTLDGLFYYSENQRHAAANALLANLQNMVAQQEGIFQSFPILGSTIQNDIADQIVNMFAFGDPNMYGSSAWQNPGDANAVSPDNMMWWNPPLFGYLEPVQYLQPHTEDYTTYKWAPYTVVGTISGIVTLNGAPVDGAQVQVNDSYSDFTSADGKYALTNVPVGSYALTASFVSGGSFVPGESSGAVVTYGNGLGGQPVQTTNANPNLVVNIPLKADLPETFRDLVVVCQVTSCDHGDDNPGNAHGVQSGPQETLHIFLGPGSPAGGCVYSFDYNKGGYFTVNYGVTATLAADLLSAKVTINATITDDGRKHQVQNSFSTAFTVPQDHWASISINNLEASGTGYHNGPANGTIVVYNNHETS